MYRRTVLAVLACVVALAVTAGSALAAPSTPTLAPMPFYVPADQQLSWAPSALDPNGLPGASAYELTLIDVDLALQNVANPGTNPPDVVTKHVYRPYIQPTTGTLNALFPSVGVGHEYELCVRTIELTTSYGVVFSTRSCAHFEVVLKLYAFKRIVDQYLSVNPDEGCIKCGLTALAKDPTIVERLRGVVVRDPAPIVGLRFDARGDATVVTG